MDKITLGFSPCPNDTFIFDALVNGKIDTEDLSFDVILDDVEGLNKRALKGELQVTKLSYNVFSKLLTSYNLLDSGGALGRGVGPLLISSRQIESSAVNGLKIAVPGYNTTANMLLNFAFPESGQKVEMLFSEIEESVLNKDVDAGVIIHENRFTYMDKGLRKIADLGEVWEQRTGCAIPLGGIAVRSDVDLEMQKKINRCIRESLEFAYRNPGTGGEYIKMHAQEMTRDAIEKHINLYVSEFSLSLGDEGLKAVKRFIQAAGGDVETLNVIK